MRRRLTRTSHTYSIYTSWHVILFYADILIIYNVSILFKLAPFVCSIRSECWNESNDIISEENRHLTSLLAADATACIVNIYSVRTNTQTHGHTRTKHNTSEVDRCATDLPIRHYMMAKRKKNAPRQTRKFGCTFFFSLLSNYKDKRHAAVAFDEARVQQHNSTIPKRGACQC